MTHNKIVSKIFCCKLNDDASYIKKDFTLPIRVHYCGSILGTPSTPKRTSNLFLYTHERRMLACMHA